MTYKQALKEVKKVGVSKCEGLAFLAMTIETLALVHAISPELVYEGAKKNGLDAMAVLKLDPVSLGNLMF